MRHHAGWRPGQLKCRRRRRGPQVRQERERVKWGAHPAGEGRDGWATDEQRTTLLILVRGRFRLDLSVASTTLEKEGDYAVWGPGIDHSWQAEEDSVVITVRWPSIPTSYFPRK